MKGFVRVERPLRMLRPVPVYLLLSGSLEEGDVNVMAASWVTPTSKKPPRIGVILDKSAYTLALARRYGWLVLGVVDYSMAELVKFVGTRSRRDVDKVLVTGLKVRGWEGDPRIPVPLEALGYLVLRVAGEHDLGPTVLLNCEIMDAGAREGFFHGESGWDLKKARILLHKSKHLFTTPSQGEFAVVKTKWGVAVKKPWRSIFEESH